MIYCGAKLIFSHYGGNFFGPAYMFQSFIFSESLFNKHKNTFLFFLNIPNLMIQLFLNVCLIRFSVETVNTLAYLPSTPSPPPCLHPHPTPSWPLRSLAFLLSHLIQFIIVGPPPYTQLSGETKALPNMDAFLFPWICAALPWGYCTPDTHTYTHALHLLPGLGGAKDTWGCSLCHLFHGWKWHSERMELNAVTAEGIFF